MAKHPSHSPAVQAAVLAALLAGQSVSQVAKEFKLPKGTVSSWGRRKLPAVRANASNAPNASSATQMKTTVGDRLLALLEANLECLVSAAEVLKDVAWLRKQNAADLAVLAGVTFDKTARLLESMGKEG